MVWRSASFVSGPGAAILRRAPPGLGFSGHRHPRFPRRTAFGAYSSALKFYDGTPVKTPADWPKRRQEILKTFAESIAAVRDLLPKLDDARMSEIWRMVSKGHEVLAQPRGEFLRDVMFSHWYQHRGQFSVYLRLLHVAVPASWGPSADEQPLFAQRAQSA